MIEEMQIQLTKGMVAVVDADDYERLKAYKWQAKRFYSGFYAVRSEFDRVKYARVGPTAGQNNHSRTILMHREIAAVAGLRSVDHKDRDTLNNKKENLRPCGQSQNGANRIRHKNNTSGFKGVTFKKDAGRWSARIGVGWKRIHLGYFDTACDAAIAYDAAARKHFGEFARCNFPDSTELNYEQKSVEKPDGAQDATAAFSA